MCVASLLARQYSEGHCMNKSVSALQCEGAVQMIVWRAPDVMEWDFLDNKEYQKHIFYCDSKELQSSCSGFLFYAFYTYPEHSYGVVSSHELEC